MKWTRTYDHGAGGTGCVLGPTAFALFTLARCGVSPDSKEFLQGVEWLTVQESRREVHVSSYERSALVLLLCEMDRQRHTQRYKKARGARKLTKNPRTRPKRSMLKRDEWRWLDSNVRHLLRHFKSRSGVGYWDYDPDYTDTSATQFAALALRAAALSGYPVARVASSITKSNDDLSFWRKLAIYHVKNQNPDGSFSYRPGTPGSWSLGMTAGALSTLVICDERMKALGQMPPDSVRTRIRRAREFLSERFDANMNVAGDRTRERYHYCYLYAVERVGVLTERKVFGSKNWYLRGARFLVDAQEDPGRWSDSTCLRPTDVLGTCFALLFLKRATVPVVTSGD